MNTQLTEDRRMSAVSSDLADVGLKRPRPPSSRPPGSRQPSSRQPSSRPTLLERLALRVGIALIIWGRGSTAKLDRFEASRRYETQAARHERERQFQRNWALVGPRR